LRLRPSGAADPAHEPGTDARTPRADPDLAGLTVFAYRHCRDQSPGRLAVLEVADLGLGVALTDNLPLARTHAGLDARWGYTPLPPLREATFRWLESADGVTVEIAAAGLEVRAGLDALGAPVFITGSHPRDRGVAYFAAMREADEGWLEIDGRRVAGEPFKHHGYVPWIGEARRSAAIQLGETLVLRRAPALRRTTCKP
jgi:hypothetical protein